MQTFLKTSLVIALLVSVGATTTSCRTYKKGTVTEKRVQIEQKDSFQEYNVKEIDDAVLSSIAYDYGRYGDGQVHMTITYDPKSRNGTALKATNEAAKLSEALRKKGVPVKSDVMPVMNSLNMKAIMSYERITALDPDCGNTLPGLEDRDHRTDFDYKMGCSVETMIARQIARPKDLLGNDAELSARDGRGIVNQIETIRSGAPNEALEGESASQ